MTHLLRLLVFLSACLLQGSPAAAAAADLTLPAAGNYVIDAQVNGRPVRLRVDPGAAGYIIMNPSAVQRVGLRASLTRAQTFIGPVRLRGSSKAAAVTIAGVTSQRRLIWMDREIYSGADGIISPADLPYDRVTMLLAEPRSGEQALQLPMQFEPSSGLFHKFKLGAQEIVLSLSANKPESMATAAAGALIAQLHGGAWAGEAREQPVSFGVPRPVRPLALQQPLPIAGLRLARFLVRTQDHRGGAQLPPDAVADPDEIVVTATRGRQRPRYVLTLGRDWLSPCSSISWNNRTRIMTLHCLAAG